MARKKKAAAVLEGADEFAGPDAEREAIEKIAASKAAADKEEAEGKTGDNGGPILDEAAWSRAVNEYSAEMLDMEDLDEKKSEVAGRISSIRKVAKSLGVDWDLVKRYYQEHKRIRKGKKGEMVTEERKYRWLLKFMGSPLGTEFSLWDLEAESQANGAAKPGMDAELQGQQAYTEGAKLFDNPFHVATDTERHNEWHHGWTQAQNANARSMGPADGEEQATH